MTFADALKRALVLYRRALLTSDAKAVDTAREVVSLGRGGHGKHGATSAHLMFARDLPLPIEMERSFARWCDVWERQLEASERRVISDVNGGGDRRSKAKRAEDRAILAAVGFDPTALAFIHGRTTESVRKLRGRHGLDPDTGERVRRDALTAPARESFKRHESATTTTTEEA